MQQAQSLAELRAQNEAEEKAQADKAAAENSEAESEEETQEGEQETETNSGEEDGNSEEEGGEGDGETEGDDDAEEWLKPGKAVPVTKHVEMKHKLRGKIDAAMDEAEKLRLENEQLKKALESRGSGSPAANQQEQELKIPKLSDDDIAYDEDKYQQRMAEYHDALIERKLSGKTQKQAETEAQQRFAQQLQSDVDKHYERAGQLVESGKITAENYQAADFNVRKAVAEAVGNDVTDFLIANLGAGSERVIYHLGVKPSALSTLTDHLKNDRTGLRAATYLGSLQAKFSGTVTTNKLSNAPKPEKTLKGSQSVTGNQHLNAFRKAEKSDDVSAMLAAKRQAKAAGVDTSNW